MVSKWNKRLFTIYYLFIYFCKGSPQFGHFWRAKHQSSYFWPSAGTHACGRHLCWILACQNPATDTNMLRLVEKMYCRNMVCLSCKQSKTVTLQLCGKNGELTLIIDWSMRNYLCLCKPLMFDAANGYFQLKSINKLLCRWPLWKCIREEPYEATVRINIKIYQSECV